MSARNCGKNLPNEARFCEQCGTTITPAAAPPAAPAAPPVSSAYQPQAMPRYAAPVMTSVRAPLSVGSYIGIFFLMMIPIANFILLLVWAFGGSVNLNKKNYARAVLLLALIGFALTVVFFHRQRRGAVFPVF